MSDVSEQRNMERLLAEASWLDALAHRLVRDAAAADDAVQEVWLAALERARDADVSTRGWLARVLGRTAARHATRDRRRREREVRHEGRATDEIAPVDDVVARAEGQRLLVEAVLALDEPYREVLLMRWFDELEPQAIALQLDRSASTVRTQLERGLEKLRARLEARHPSAREWLVRLVPLALVGSRRGATETAVASAAATRTAHPAALAAGGAVLVAGAALVWFATGDDPPALEVARDSVTEFATESGDAEGAPNELDPAPIDDDHREEATAQGAADVVESGSPTSDVLADSPAAVELPPGTLEFVLTIDHALDAAPSIGVFLASSPFTAERMTFVQTDIPSVWTARFEPAPGGVVYDQTLDFMIDLGVIGHIDPVVFADVSSKGGTRVPLTFGSARAHGTVFGPPKSDGGRSGITIQLRGDNWLSGMIMANEGREFAYDSGHYLPTGDVGFELHVGDAEFQVTHLHLTPQESRAFDFGWSPTSRELRGSVEDALGRAVDPTSGGLDSTIAALRAMAVDGSASHTTHFDSTGYSLRLPRGTYDLATRSESDSLWNTVAQSVVVESDTTFDVAFHGVTFVASAVNDVNAASARVRRDAPTESTSMITQRANDGQFTFVALTRGSWTLELLDGAENVVESHAFEIDVDTGLVERVFGAN